MRPLSRLGSLGSSVRVRGSPTSSQIVDFSACLTVARRSNVAANDKKRRGRR